MKAGFVDSFTAEERMIINNTVRSLKVIHRQYECGLLTDDEYLMTVARVSMKGVLDVDAA